MNTMLLALLLGAFLVCLGIGAQETTRVEIDVKEAGADISPLLFGHNLEVTRRGGESERRETHGTPVHADRRGRRAGLHHDAMALLASIRRRRP